MSLPPDDHLKALWKGQETEHPPMSVATIRAIAERRRQQIRQGLIAFCVVSAVAAPSFVWRAWSADDALIRAGALIVVAGYAWMVWRGLRTWPRRLPGDAASAAVLVDFHRRQLVRQQMSLGQMVVTVGPIVTGFLVMVAGMHRRERGDNAWVLVALVALWFALMYLVLQIRRRRVQAKLDELDGFDGR
ncbi:MAG TPA: hypothetical protein VIE16_07660 [Phenylobacterium sp.]|jgi:hypothetical protein